MLLKIKFEICLDANRNYEASSYCSWANYCRFSWVDRLCFFSNLLSKKLILIGLFLYVFSVICSIAIAVYAALSSNDIYFESMFWTYVNTNFFAFFTNLGVFLICLFVFKNSKRKSEA